MLSKQAIEYCEKTRGINYAGCGSDYGFCKLCREQTNSKEQLIKLINKINNYGYTERINIKKIN